MHPPLFTTIAISHSHPSHFVTIPICTLYTLGATIPIVIPGSAFSTATARPRYLCLLPLRNETKPDPGLYHRYNARDRICDRHNRNHTTQHQSTIESDSQPETTDTRARRNFSHRHPSIFRFFALPLEQSSRTLLFEHCCLLLERALTERLQRRHRVLFE